MRGLGAQRSDSATTPGRKTHFRFDVDEYVMRQPAWSIDRAEEQIQPITDNPDYSSDNIEFVPGSGWTLASIQADSNQLHELGAAVDSLTVPSGYGTLGSWAKSTAGSPTYAGGVSASGDSFYNRNLAASDTVGTSNYNLASDVSSYAGPSLSANCTLNRVAKGSETGPIDKIFSFEVRGNPKSSPDYVACYSFNGPQGWPLNPSNYYNTGYYQIAFKGNGRFELRVLLWNGSSSSYQVVKTGWYCAADQVHNKVHRVYIQPRVNYPNGTDLSPCAVSGGTILFRFTTSDKPISNPPKSAHASLMGSQASLTDQIGSFHAKYTAPGVAFLSGPANYPHRVDTRQDLDVSFQTSTVTYKTSGHLLDAPFQLPFLPDFFNGTTTPLPFTIMFWGYWPAGTSITAQILCVEPNPGGSPPLSYVSIGSGLASGGNANPVIGQRYYQVRFTYSGTSSARPFLKGYRVYRSGEMIVNSPGEFSPAFQPADTSPPTLRKSFATGPLSVTMADSDPSTASASFNFVDLYGDLAKLQARGDFACIVETEIPEDVTGVTRVKWHRGYVRLPESEQKGNHHTGWYPGLNESGLTLSDYPYKYMFKGTISVTGAWQRLQEALMPVRFNFAVGTVDSIGNPVLPKVTDAMRTLFSFAGIDSTQISIPDLPITLFPSDNADSLVIEPQASIKDLLVRWAREYFGGYLYFEPNAGTYGKWLLLRQKTAPYTLRAAFTTSGPGAGKVQNSVQAYGTTVISGQTVQQYPIFKGLHWHPKPPEINCVISYGPQESEGGQDAALVCMVAYNLASFPFPGFSASAPDPSSPDYLSRQIPGWQYLPSYATSRPGDLTSPLAFATRRTFDIAARGRLQKLIIAPAVYFYDSEEGYYRGLRFYDEVYVDGDWCLIRNARLIYSHDDNQLCEYTVEKILSGVPATVSESSNVTGYRKALAKNSLQHIAEPIQFGKIFAQEKRSWGEQSAIHALPTIPTSKIQNSDGSFVWMLDYDLLG